MNSEKAENTAVIAGASGLTGGHCLNNLLENDNFPSVIMLNRRPLNISHPKLREIVVDFDNFSGFVNNISGAHFFCCLGTTIKKAGGETEFRRVDYQYPLSLAKLAKIQRARQFCLVSAMGASANSSIFYNRVKGELERDLRALELSSLQIFRPSLLAGKRAESRPAEKLAYPLMRIMEPLMRGPLKKYRAIQASVVARAMVDFSLLNIRGVEIYDSAQIQFYTDQVKWRENAS